MDDSIGGGWSCVNLEGARHVCPADRALALHTSRHTVSPKTSQSVETRMGAAQIPTASLVLARTASRQHRPAQRPKSPLQREGGMQPCLI